LAENLVWCQNDKLSYASLGSGECNYKAVVQRSSQGNLNFFFNLFFSPFCIEKKSWFSLGCLAVE